MPWIDHFGILAPFYERAIPLTRVERINELVDLPEGGSLLDAGGGTGRVAQVFQGRAGRVVVADLSLGMLQEARAKNGLAPVNSHTEKLPFPEATFDRVLMVDALHHVCNQQETAAEMWRVLEPGGRIVIEEPDVRTWVVKLIALFEKLALMRSHFLAPPQIAAMFTQDGAQVRVEREGFNAWILVEKT